MRGWRRGYRQQQARYWSSWSHHWQPGANQPPQAMPPVFAPVFVAPLLSILLFGLVVMMVWAIYSLATSHAFLGIALPATMPLWVGILLVVVAYQLVSWPIKSARYACYFPGHYRHGGPFGGLVGSLIGLFFLGFGIWYMDRHVPE